MLALYLYTKKREGRLVSEEVGHFVYWHDGRSRSVPAGAGGFDRSEHAALTAVQFGLASST